MEIEMKDDIKIVEEFQWKLKFPFSVIKLGKIFASKTNRILVGTSQGTILIYGPHSHQEQQSNSQKEILVWEEENILETKGGAIQTFLLQEITNFGSIDLIVGDNRGEVIIFSSGEILSRMRLSDSSIISLAVLNGGSIVAGDQEGILHAFQMPYEPCWKLRLGDDISIFNSYMNKISVNNTSSSSIQHLLTTKILNKYGEVIHVLLLCNGTSYLHYYAENQRIFSLQAPSRITSLCTGYFLSSLESFNNHMNKLQIAISCDNGYICIIEDFKIVRSICVGQVVTHLVAHPRNNSPHLLFCCGYFNALKAYWKGKILFEHKTSDWILTFDLAPTQQDNSIQVVMGLTNQEIVVSNIFISDFQ